MSQDNLLYGRTKKTEQCFVKAFLRFHLHPRMMKLNSGGDESVLTASIHWLLQVQHPKSPTMPNRHILKGVNS